MKMMCADNRAYHNRASKKKWKPAETTGNHWKLVGNHWKTLEKKTEPGGNQQ